MSPSRSTCPRIRAITVIPGAPGSAELAQIDDPAPTEHELLAETIAVGVCGTDREILSGIHGQPPPGRDRLVLGHEWLGRVRTSRGDDRFEPGALVSGIVRRPDPEPCPCCARGEFDMCRNGRYRERGIKELDGYGAELVTLEPQFAVQLDPSLSAVGVLTEPTSVVAKAWEHIQAITMHGCRPLHSVLVTGAGPIGLLTAMLGIQRGFALHVLDRATTGSKPRLVEALGATYLTGTVEEACGSSEPDIIVECTGSPDVVAQIVQFSAPDAIICLTGVAPRGRTLPMDIGSINNEIVLENDVVLGSVNANHRHFQAAVDALARADHDWLGGLITRRVPLERWTEALDRQPDDIKTIIEFEA